MVSDTMWSRQVPSGIREIEAIASAADENNWQDVLATVLCKSTLALARMSDSAAMEKPLLDLLGVWRSSLSGHLSNVSKVWKQALLKSFSRLSSVLLPATATATGVMNGGSWTTAHMPYPLPLLLGISRSIGVFQEIMEPLLSSAGAYWQFFPTSFFHEAQR